jgi:hypothetical protein
LAHGTDPFALEEQNMPDTTPPSGQPTTKELNAALKAFKKRLKLTQLNEESKLTRSATTSGHADIVAIMPPNQHPQAVWDELVRQGKLKKAGQGTYELAQE